jgi:hypothetical protein
MCCSNALGIIYVMRRTQLYLEDDLWKTLQSTVSELVRRALREKYLDDAATRKEALLSAVGLWKDRTDPPDTETISADSEKATG